MLIIATCYSLIEQQRMEVWQQDLSNGLDIHHNCWTNLLGASIDQEATNITTALYQPYKHGIGFKVSDGSFAVQGGDNASTVMSRLAYFDLATHSWSSRKCTAAYDHHLTC